MFCAVIDLVSKVIECIRAVVDSPPRMQAVIRLLEETPTADLTPDLLDVIEYIVFGRAGTALRRWES